MNSKESGQQQYRKAYTTIYIKSFKAEKFHSITKILHQNCLPYSWILSRYLNSANGRFSVFSWIGSAKMGNYLEQLFFMWLNFMNDQHPQNSQNLRTLKKPTIWYVQNVSSVGKGFTTKLFLWIFLNSIMYETFPIPSYLCMRY